MSRWRGFLAALALAACVAAPVAPAMAEGEAETGAFGAFRLKGSNGFSIFAIAVSKPNFKHGELGLFVGGRSGSAIYLAPAKVEPTAIEADLGAVGRVDVHFEPSGPPERVYARCEENGSALFEPGYWVGTIEFEGEEGFTSVEVARTRAIVSPFFELGACGAVLIGESDGRGVEGARLIARSASAHETRFLQANKNHDGARVYLEADVEERHDGLIVDRQAGGYFPSAAFGFGPSLRTATLAPSGPFAGHATFHRNAKPANRWTGNLTVDFPGRADVPLAGRGFKAALGHWNRTESKSRNRRITRGSRLLGLLSLDSHHLLRPWP
ncbi:MAG TPA: hypothetical protein VFN18_10650 [Solirubrobacterales bacterium]|nr:hypothetical protein [Solirubrobacterales bacterium]